MKFHSLQEACDYAVKKIVEQGGQCKGPQGQGCSYGDGEGRHCAVGWLVPEDHPEYQKIMEVRGTVRYLLVDYPKALGWLEDHADTLELLQEFHDSLFKKDRLSAKTRLQEEHGIDTSGEHWTQWVEAASAEFKAALDKYRKMEEGE